MSIDAFFNYARERYKIRWLKDVAGHPPPWTNDGILRLYRFCNVFREDDKVTKWIKENVRDPFFDDPAVLPALVIARWFNRIETMELLLGGAGKQSLFSEWDSEIARYRLRNCKPLVTGAYMVKTPKGKDKLNGVLWCIDQFMEMWREERSMDGSEFPPRLQELHTWLCTAPYLGPFMAYEVVTDMRWTVFYDNAPDVMTWANPGPGAARGMSRVLGKPVTHFNRHSRKDVAEIMKGMQTLLACSQDPQYWPSRWPKWEMREVEHTLCEFDKYERARTGAGFPKQRYNGGA